MIMLAILIGLFVIGIVLGIVWMLNKLGLEYELIVMYSIFSILFLVLAWVIGSAVLSLLGVE